MVGRWNRYGGGTAQARDAVRTPLGGRTPEGYLFPASSPAIGTFTLYPFIQGLTLSFQTWDGVSTTAEFVGLRNYERVMGDPNFWDAENAATFGLIGFLLGNALSLGMAIAVNSRPPGAAFNRTAFSSWRVLSRRRWLDLRAPSADDRDRQSDAACAGTGVTPP